jgi:hypothetical protein
MTSIQLPKDPETLFLFAEEFADAVGEDDGFRIDPRAEARLRAAIAAAVYARSAYFAMREGAGQSEIARLFLDDARAACNRTEAALRSQLRRLIAQVRMCAEEVECSSLTDLLSASI